MLLSEDSSAGDDREKTMPARHAPTRRQHFLGIALVLAVACIWVIAAELIQYVFTDFNSPFFLTYYSVSLFSVCLLGFFRRSWREACRPRTPYQPLTDPSSPDAVEAQPLSITSPAMRALRLAALLSPIFFFSNYTFNVGLSFTSVASSSTIATLTALFTLILGALSGVERFSCMKLIATVLVIGGVALISENDERHAGKDHLNGDLISILSAAICSMYTIVLKHKAGPDGEMPMLMMLAFMGFLTAILEWPLFFFVDHVGWEPFKIPSWRNLAMLTINGLLGTVLSDFLWAKGIVLTTPVIGTLSLSLSVPLSIIADLILGRAGFDWIYLVGAGLAFIGFIIVNLDEARVRERETADESVPALGDFEETEMQIQLQETGVR